MLKTFLSSSTKLVLKLKNYGKRCKKMDEPKILVQREEKEDKDYFVELNGNAKEC